MLNPHRPQYAQVNIGHARLAMLPVDAMLQSHVRPACNQRRNVVVVMSGAGTAAIHNDRVVQHRALAILIGAKHPQFGSGLGSVANCPNGGDADEAADKAMLNATVKNAQ